jgi:hypothetical protein
MASRKRKQKADINIHFSGHDLTIEGDGTLHVTRRLIQPTSGDHGADPLGEGLFRMVPSGDIVSFEERNRRLKR